MSAKEDDLPIDWEGLSYAAGGSARGLLDQSQSGVALGVLADIECILAQERLERLAAEIQSLLESDPDFSCEKEKEGVSTNGVVQLVDGRNPVRGVQGRDDRGCSGGPRGLSEVWPDSSKANVRPRLDGSMFFEIAFCAPSVYSLVFIKSNL
jgi:hypothetical protein